MTETEPALEMDTPKPPSRPRSARKLIKEKREKPIWLTVITKSNRAVDMWCKEPGALGLKLQLPWSEVPDIWAIGDQKGAYTITWDEEHQCRRLIVYEGLPIAPVYIQQGEWETMEEEMMNAKTLNFINDASLQTAARLPETAEEIPKYVWLMFIMAIVGFAAGIVWAVLGATGTG